MILLILLPLLTMVDASCISSGYTGYENCPDLDTVPGCFAEYAQKPFFLQFANTSDYDNVDSVCYTADCLPDGCEYFIVYTVYVYFDGSTLVSSYILTTSSVGLFISSSANSYQLQYSLGTTSNGTNVGYACDECGQEMIQFGFGTSSTYGQISDNDLQESYDRLAEQGIYLNNTVVLPMRLGPMCYYSSCTNCNLSASSCSYGSGPTTGNGSCTT